MRKRIITPATPETRSAEGPWLDVAQLAEVEITSEDPSFPIESALQGQNEGWRAADPGAQTIRLCFDRPQPIRRIRLVFRATEERNQEFLLSWSPENSQSLREIVRQQYQFSPGGSVEEIEDYQVELPGAAIIELSIVPNRSGGPARASLAEWKLA